MSSVDNLIEDKKFVTQLSVPTAKEKGTLEQDNAMIKTIFNVFKTTGIGILIWCWGYLGMSVAWLFVGLFFHMISNEVRKQMIAMKSYTRQAMLCEKEAILSRVDGKSSWVFFPDIEKAEWMNKIIKQMWPLIADYGKNLILTSIQESIQNNMPKDLKEFKFDMVDLGDLPPRIDGVKVYTDVQKKQEIVLDFGVKYAGDANIKVSVKGVVAGIKGLKLNGKMRVIFNPLISDMPIIGGMSVFFLNAPLVEFDMTGTANVLDLPILKNSVSSLVNDIISRSMVLPRRLAFQLGTDVDFTEVQFPSPQGVVIIHVIEAKNLIAADTNILKKNKSDPYCKLTVGNQTMSTKVIPNNLDPNWNEYFQAVVDQKHGQMINIQLWDHDMGAVVDDQLGTTFLDIEQISRKGLVDIWLPLSNVATGKIHLRALWMPCSSSIDDYVPTVKTGGVSDTFPSAVLAVTVVSAKDLPFGDKSGKKRNPFVTLKLASSVQKTTIKMGDNDPIWGENFQFLVLDPQKQEIEITILHKGAADRTLGVMKQNLNQIMMSENMTLVKNIEFKETMSLTQLNCRFVMRLLTNRAVSSWSEMTGPAAMSMGNMMKGITDIGHPTKSITSSNTSSVGDQTSNNNNSPGVLPSFNRPSLASSVQDKPEIQKRTITESPYPQNQRTNENLLEPKQSQSQLSNTSNSSAPAASGPTYSAPVAEKKESIPSMNTPTQLAKATEVQRTPSIKLQPTAVNEIKSVSPPANQGLAGQYDKPIREQTPPQASFNRHSIASSIHQPSLEPMVKKSISKLGQIQLTVRYSTARTSLIVVVHQCKNLIPCDKDNLADPYVRLYLLPDKSAESKRRTKLIKNTLSPCFDETFDWVLGQMEIPFRSLDIAVKNDVGLFSKSRTEMGSILIDLSSLGDLSQATTQWFDLVDPKSI